ncbi:hypothetical protein [uncultured Sanguibacteroides sp.]|uniref:hypothetical protein n=1 Tax=uncultured Sanguibacteroides sp. TaxID=1635151 RepID=UPI0025F4BC17|nr:hypothetical protein [uncultured Sanguibacteroides sp.]
MTMKNYKLWMLSLVLVGLMSGCYKEDDIQTTKGDVLIDVKEGDDEVDQYIYRFYQANGSVIMYEFSELDYRWNMSSVVKNVTMVLQEDKAVLKNGLALMEKVFFNVYDQDFQKNYFPLKILMAKSIEKMEWGIPTPQAVLTGLSYIAIGNIAPGVESLSRDEIRDIREKVNAEFWLSYLVKGGFIHVPESFYEVSKQYYQEYLDRLPENEGVEEVDVKKYGFWKKDDYASWAVLAPDRDLDFKDFMGVITTTPYDELKPILDKYGKLKDKYTILANTFKEKYHIDITLFGNR